MSSILTLVAAADGPAIDDSMIDAARAVLGGLGAAPAATPEWLAPARAVDLAFSRGDPVEIQSAVKARLADARLDIAAQPRAGRRKRLLVADMESTIIDNEFVDELAAEAGVGARVAEITGRVVRGEIEFAAALEKRVAMLAGLPVSVLDRVYAGLRLNPGARTLVRTMRAHGAHTALVSGGFTCFSGRVHDAVGFDSHDANVLETMNGQLTGKVATPILDRAGKRCRLLTLAADLGIGTGEVMAIGDGANDLDMIATAGMGVAYRAKPIVAEDARARIDHGDLTALLYLQGYRTDEFRH